MVPYQIGSLLLVREKLSIEGPPLALNIPKHAGAVNADWDGNGTDMHRPSE
jgi:hypothetical protein